MDYIIIRDDGTCIIVPYVTWFGPEARSTPESAVRGLHFAGLSSAMVAAMAHLSF